MNFIELLKSGEVIVWDGAMGTNIVSKLPSDSAFTNKSAVILRPQVEGSPEYKFICNEELNLTHPEIIQKIHEEFLNAGAQVLEANTFSANRIVLAEHGLADKIREINLAAVKIAKEAVSRQPSAVSKTCGQRPTTDDSSGQRPTTNGQRRFISADIGPSSKLPTLGHISFEEMVAAYKEQAEILIEAGVDILQVVTCQDILQAKAAVVGCREAMKQNPPSPPFEKGGTGGILPIIVTVTVEPTGTMLLGTEIGSALAALEPLGISAFGLNCATGPAEMEEHIRYIKDNSDLPIAVLPNAGLPEIKDGVAHYPLTSDKFAEWMEYFVKELGVQIVGGCCGTTPEHIKQVAKLTSCQVNKLNSPSPPFTKGGLGGIKPSNQVSSLYSPTPLDQEPRPLIVGERMNINGSKEFREYILAENFDAAAGMAKKQAETGAHVLDLSVAYAGRDEVKDMHEIARRLATMSPLPLMIDSTNPSAIEAALSHIGGRSIINSINLEDGGKKASEIIKIAKQHGSALVALTIGEEGMALTADKKVAIAKRLMEFCCDQGGDGTPPLLLIDLLTFTLADPKAAEAGSGRETLEAIKQLKQIPPPPPLQRGEYCAPPPLQRGEYCAPPPLQKGKYCAPPPFLKGGQGGLHHRTILGISNISYGLKPSARRVLNSIFLHEAVSAGLDAALVHAGNIMPLHKIDKKLADSAMDLIYCRGKDALAKFLAYFEEKQEAGGKKQERAKIKDKDTELRLREKIIDGDKNELPEIIELAIKKMPATEVINKILLPAMQKVGELFGAGELQLPFVLQSAEAMRASVGLLSPHLEKGANLHRGTIVLATVRGDVHDIGKNLVDIILSNNGYKVINLGVKQTIDNVIKSAQENNSGVIGLSGLLVQSCLVMKEDLAELAHRGIMTPVICGGAALTRKFVENDLQNVYGGKVYYAKDAFDGLKLMSEITNDQAPRYK